MVRLPFVSLLLCGFAATLVLMADDTAIRKEIQTVYDRALRGLETAKTIDDLDSGEKLVDTPDWVSIVNDGTPQHWSDLREATAGSIGHFSPTAIRILKLTVNGDRATVIARVGPPKDVSDGGDPSHTMLVRDTWVKTGDGWRRKVHEKPASGKLDAELK